MWTYETHRSFPYIHFRPDDNWSILSQHQPDFKSVQRAFFLETKLVSYVQATDSDCWYNHYTALTGVGLSSHTTSVLIQEEAQPKKVESTIPHKLPWVLKVSPNDQHSILQEALAYHLTRAVTAVVPSRTLTSSATCVTSTTILALRMTHHPCLDHHVWVRWWIQNLKLTTINRLLQCNIHNGVCTSIVHVRSLRPGWLHTRIVQSCRTPYQNNWSRWNRWDNHTFLYQHWKCHHFDTPVLYNVHVSTTSIKSLCAQHKNTHQNLQL